MSKYTEAAEHLRKAAELLEADATRNDGKGRTRWYEVYHPNNPPGHDLLARFPNKGNALDMMRRFSEAYANLSYGIREVDE